MKKILFILYVGVFSLLLPCRISALAKNISYYDKYHWKEYQIETKYLQGKLLDDNNKKCYLATKNKYTDFIVNNVFGDLHHEENIVFIDINSQGYFIDLKTFIDFDKRKLLKSINLKSKNNQSNNTNSSTANNTNKEMNWVNINNAIKELGKTIKEAKNNGMYNPQDIVSINRSIIIDVNGFRIALDERAMSDNKYYVVINFSIINISNKDYYNSLTNFILQDNYGDTYDPDLAFNINGNVDGNIVSKGMREGEIAFEVPVNQTEFILHYSTKAGFSLLKSLSNESETIHFKINVKNLKKNQ